MKIIHHRTGIDIMQCNDINILKDIILESMEASVSLCEEYGFFVLKCYRERLPIISVRDWLQIRNK